MNRTFHYRISWINYLTILIVASATVFFLWNRSAVNVAIGFVLMMVAVKMVERIIHTEYVFTDDGMLVIDKGR
ncbi:MAG: hypothetical protein Q4D41_12925, partial [Prevotellaceae bacterium]|nr:hypothetical protein [Prevotellaceae bacterium]